MNNIYITLPGFTQNSLGNNFKINLKLIDLLNSNPEYFYSGIIITSVYDNFPCIWGGGRAIPPKEKIQDEEIINTLIPFMERRIQIRYNFSNCLLEQKHLLDENCNHILDISTKLAKSYNTKIGIVIYSDILYQYIKKTYSNIEFIFSTTLGQIGEKQINNLTEKNILVLDYMYNNNFSFLNKLKHPENIEILANEACVPGCPHRQLHFKLYSAVQLGRIKPWLDNSINIGCINNNNKRKPEEKQVTINNFINNYMPIGINRLKIVGRLVSNEMLINDYLKWLIKPEYYETVKEILYG